MKTVKRTYTCRHCYNLFYVFQPPSDEAIKHYPCCEAPKLSCSEEQVRQFNLLTIDNNL